MANIKNHLNNIKNALFGQEVRGSIHDGIDAINKEVEITTGRQVDLEKTFDQLVINAGNSNAEIVDARVKSDGTSYSKLGDRLNEVDSQLEHIKNINKVVYIKDFGAIGDGVTDDTNAIQKALDYCANEKNVKLVFQSGTYLHSDLLLEGEGFMNIVIEGEGKVTLKPYNISSYALHIRALEASTTPFRYLTINNLNFDPVPGEMQGNVYSQGVALNLEFIQFAKLNNVYITNFNGGGVIFNNVWDSSAHDLRILRCCCNLNGLEYALVLTGGKRDNVNATKFYGLQIEHCPKMLFVEKSCRHNLFTGCKFEQSKDNHTNYAPIMISSNNYENVFNGCQFVMNSIGGNNLTNYFMHVDNNYIETDYGTFNLVIDNCMFTTSSSAWNSALWLNINKSTVTNCIFDNCSESSFPFVLRNNNLFSNNKIYSKGVGSYGLQISGNCNLITDNTFYFEKTYTEGAYIKVDSGCNNNILTDNLVIGSPMYYYSSNNYLDNNVIKVKNKNLVEITDSNENPSLIDGADNILFNVNTPNLNVRYFKFGYNGQVINCISKIKNTVYIYDDSKIITKSGENYKPESNEIVSFLNIKGVWYQI